jgi:hypothetical protein
MRSSELVCFAIATAIAACSAFDDGAGAGTPRGGNGGTGAGGTGGGATGAGGNAGSSGSGSVSPDGGPTDGGPGGSGGGTSHDHCVLGFDPDPRDMEISNLPTQWKATNGDIDLVLPKGVLDWMGERLWEKSHDAWHNVRRCKSGGFPGIPGGTDTTTICMRTELIPEHQECADAEDGYAFLVMHRHMMRALRQAFPQHNKLFEGFPKFPFNATDVPEEWRGRWGTGWSSSIKSVATTLEDIENQHGRFPTEGDLGKYIQCGTSSSGASSIHGAMHFKWVVNSSPYSLGKQAVNIDNYMFWKLHGWIDTIWERYRVAKGQAPDEAKLTQALIDQCHEMHTLGAALEPSSGVKPDAPLPIEHGFFHEKVRPILEKTCSGCHSETSPDGNLKLGGHISSADVVKGLVNVQSVRGGQFKRVVPGNPDQSWFYLKPAGKAASAGCTGTGCNTQGMPPTGRVTLSTAELDTIRQWITDGAPLPTQ